MKSLEISGKVVMDDVMMQLALMALVVSAVLDS